MTKRAEKIVVVGEVAHRPEANALLKGLGSAVLVRRGILRSIVMQCPDGCDDILTINLDARSGPAWRLYYEKRGVSLYPSVWRHTGCGSHFILWRSRLFWCDADYTGLDGEDQVLEDKVAALLREEFVSFRELAESLGEIPWSVLVACHRLVRRGRALEGTEEQRGCFRRGAKQTAD